MKTNDHDYFARRAADERAAAERADNAHAKDVHLELAHRYEAAAAAAIGIPVVQLRVTANGNPRRAR